MKAFLCLLFLSVCWVSSLLGDDDSDHPYGEMDGFESGEILDNQHGGIWVPCGPQYERWVCGHITAVTSPVRSGKYAANITCQPGDTAEEGGSTERDELDSGKWFELGKDLWYGWSFMLPTDFEITDDRFVMSQYKQSGRVSGGSSPIFGFRYVNAVWYVTLRLEDYNTNGTETVFDLPTLILGQWHDMIVNVRFDVDETMGYFNVWVNGTQEIEYKGRSAYLPPGGGERFYHKTGIYRDAWPDNWTMFFDNYKIGHNYQEVDPSSPTNWPN
eukprot:CAMPEP_0201520944 /NCGR_PEP_ID=MMETSP0161_2-20130828/13436_1 /ASSEMBLY_ACC=CAM_ASM_000251 /TAXON_ID=180227 /ORGANISM="Neoparamoeba aestuarina, Strain SoJaBio B1-5/56/2" /LENGTH=271 /DNA_ID=CAMNT_0047919477 /DNA_START=143 /DNA_END=958 /DNA_ORIENTATION=-